MITLKYVLTHVHTSQSVITPSIPHPTHSSCLQETGGGHLPGAASLLAHLVSCGQLEVESEMVSSHFVGRLLSACLQYPTANPLHCATMQLMR